MKKLLYSISFLCVMLLVVSGNIAAQSTTDTVRIPGSSSLNISNIINADTSVTAPRIYVLDRGAIYYIDRAFELTHSSTFIATGDASKRPPVLAPAIRADDTSEEWYFKLITQGIKVDLSDLYLLSLRSDGKSLGWSRAIHIGASNCSLKLRRVVFDGWSEVGIRIDGADFTKLDVQDCHFRNMAHASSFFGGQPFLSNHLDHPDTTIFINNTFFACNAYMFSIRGVDPKSVFEHNSVIYSIVNPFIVERAQNLHFNNNLLYDVNAFGGDPFWLNQSSFLNFPDSSSSQIFHLGKKYADFFGYPRTGPEVYFNDLGLVYDPGTRVVQAHKNVLFNSEKLVQFYTSWNDTVATMDSITDFNDNPVYVKRTLTMAPWLSRYGKAVRDSLTNPSSWDYSSTVNVEDPINADPQFSDAGAAGHVDQLVNYVREVAKRTVNQRWDYELNFPPKWPIPENLAYANTALQSAGTDGFAIGDLNWFPAQKAAWLLTDVRPDNSEMPSQYSLSEAYPNPFNPETNFKFSITSAGNVKLAVYNLLGQKVKTLFDSELNAGSYTAKWDATDDFGHKVSSGVYFFRFESGTFNSIRKMLLMK